MDRLHTYRSNRAFDATREPRGDSKRIPRSRSKQMFVVQKHDASRLHYDFRLGMEGVLKSWAVPKGIPLDKGERRLAREVEDPPLEYGDFEGIIPEGNHGAGTVQLWDHGKYEVTGDPPEKGLRQGKLSIVLHGKKLKGHWTLLRLPRENESQKAWLLIKTVESLHGLSARKANPGSSDHEAGERSFGNFCLSVSTRSKRSPLLLTRSSTAAGEKLNWSRSFALNPVSSSLHVRGVETEG
jgi:DNA ligase D-like protein (predicted 3'-phosphoesterase)